MLISYSSKRTNCERKRSCQLVPVIGSPQSYSVYNYSDLWPCSSWFPKRRKVGFVTALKSCWRLVLCSAVSLGGWGTWSLTVKLPAVYGVTGSHGRPFKRCCSVLWAVKRDFFVWCVRVSERCVVLQNGCAVTNMSIVRKDRLESVLQCVLSAWQECMQFVRNEDSFLCMYVCVSVSLHFWCCHVSV